MVCSSMDRRASRCGTTNRTHFYKAFVASHSTPLCREAHSFEVQHSSVIPRREICSGSKAGAKYPSRSKCLARNLRRSRFYCVREEATELRYSSSLYRYNLSVEPQCGGVSDGLPRQSCSPLDLDRWKLYDLSWDIENMAVILLLAFSDRLPLCIDSISCQGVDRHRIRMHWAFFWIPFSHPCNISPSPCERVMGRGQRSTETSDMRLKKLLVFSKKLTTLPL